MQSGIQRYPGDGQSVPNRSRNVAKPMQSGGIVRREMYEIYGQSFLKASAYINRFRTHLVAGMLIYKEPTSTLQAQAAATQYVSTCIQAKKSGAIPQCRHSHLLTTRRTEPQPARIFQPILCYKQTGEESFDAYTGKTNVQFTGVQRYPCMGPNGEHIRTTCSTTAHPATRLYILYLEFHLNVGGMVSPREPKPPATRTKP